TGRKSVVLDAPSADYFLLSARSSGNRTDAEGISLFLVRRDAPGLTLQAYPTQSGGRAADLHLQDVSIGDDAVIGAPERALPVIAAIQAAGDEPAARRRALSGAKAYIGQAARFVGQQAVQLHGAMGVVDELNVSHYFKRLTMIDMTFGDADHHLARFSDAL